MKRKWMTVLTMLCMCFLLLPMKVSAGNVGTIHNYAELVEASKDPKAWFTDYSLEPDSDFGWPEGEVKITLDAQSVYLNKSWTIPANVTLYMYLIVPEDVTLTVEGSISSVGNHGVVNVNGKDNCSIGMNGEGVYHINGDCTGASDGGCTIYVNGTLESTSLDHAQVIVKDGGKVAALTTDDWRMNKLTIGSDTQVLIKEGGEFSMGSSDELVLDGTLTVEKGAQVFMETSVLTLNGVLETEEVICVNNMKVSGESAVARSNLRVKKELTISGGKLTVPEGKHLIAEYRICLEDQGMLKVEKGGRVIAESVTCSGAQMDVSGNLILRSYMSLQGDCEINLNDGAAIDLAPDSSLDIKGTDTERKDIIHGSGMLRFYAENVDYPENYEQPEDAAQLAIGEDGEEWLTVIYMEETASRPEFAEGIQIWWNWKDRTACEHQWEDLSVTCLPTCQDGYQGEVCNSCGLYQEKVLNAVEEHETTLDTVDDGMTCKRVFETCGKCKETVGSLRFTVKDAEYTGKPIENAELIKYDAWRDREFEVIYKNNIEVGTATAELTVTGSNGDTLTVSLKFRIKKSKNPIIDNNSGNDSENSGNGNSNENVSLVFTDVGVGDWFVSAVQYVYERGIMNGYGGSFTPNTNISRAMVVETLYKMQGKPYEGKTDIDFTAYDGFGDLKRSDWWANSVAWALNEGIATGDIYHQKFNPNADVTREQLAAFIYRYAEYTGKEPVIQGNIDSIIGQTPVNEWAKKEFAWAIEQKLISGLASKDAQGTIIYDLSPRTGATRAQMATILQRFLK